MLSPIPEVIPRTVCMMGGIPHEWLDDSRPFNILDESYGGTIAKVKVAYKGFENDEFISVALPQFTISYFGNDTMAGDDGKPLFTRPRYLLLRHSDGCESDASPILRTLPLEIYSDERPQFITYDQCTEQELVFVDQDKRQNKARQSLIMKTQKAVATLYSCLCCD